MTDREKLIELLKSSKLCSKRFDDQYSDETIAVIANHLLENGVIVPPVKVGDTVYYFSRRPFNLSVWPNTIYEADVIRIVTTRLATSLVIQIHNEYGVTEIPEASSFGSTVFLTREEAEKALKERGNNV